MSPLEIEPRPEPTLDPYKCPHGYGLRRHSKGHDIQHCGLVDAGSGLANACYCPLVRCATCPQEDGDYVKKSIANTLVHRITKYWWAEITGGFTLTVEDSLRRLKDREGVAVAEDALVAAVTKGLPQAEAERLADSVFAEAIER